MSSVCECYIDGEAMGVRHGPVTCRTEAPCCYCKRPILIGDPCYTIAWFVPGDPGYGGHAKAHEVCERLRSMADDILCDGLGCYAWEGFDFDAAASEITLRGDPVDARRWMELYETTWEK